MWSRFTQPTSTHDVVTSRATSKTDLKKLLDEQPPLLMTLLWLAVPIACLLVSFLAIFYTTGRLGTATELSPSGASTNAGDAASLDQNAGQRMIKESQERLEAAVATSSEQFSEQFMSQSSILESLREQMTSLPSKVQEGIVKPSGILSAKDAKELEQQNKRQSEELAEIRKALAATDEQGLVERIEQLQQLTELKNKKETVSQQIAAAAEALGKREAENDLLNSFNRTTRQQVDIPADGDLPEETQAIEALMKAFLINVAKHTNETVNSEEGGLRQAFQSNLTKVSKSLDRLAQQKFPVAEGQSESLLILLPCTPSNAYICKENLYPTVKNLHAEFSHWEAVIPRFTVDCHIGLGATLVRFRDEKGVSAEPAFSGESRPMSIPLPEKKYDRCVLILGCQPNDLARDYPLPTGAAIDVILAVKGTAQDTWNEATRDSTKDSLAHWHDKLNSHSRSGSSLAIVYLDNDNIALISEIRRRLLPAMLQLGSDID